MRPFLRTAVALALLFAAARSDAAINGSVMTTDGQPIAGARVSILGFETSEVRRTRLQSSSPEQVPMATTQTDAKGGFSLASPKETVVNLTIFARGYDPVKRHVERDEEVGAVMLLKSETKRGSVTAGGKPVAGATIVIDYGAFEYVTKSGEDGKYDAPDPKRAQTITVLHPDYAIEDESLFMAGATAAKLNRTLVAGTQIKGTVVALDGQTPAAKFSISLDGWPRATSGEDGTFTIAHVPSKWTTLTARKDSLLGTKAFSKDASHAIRLARAGTISGRVLDTKTKVPVVGAQVIAVVPRIGVDTSHSAITDARGSFSLIVPPGSYWLISSHPAYDRNRGDAAVVGGQSATKDVALTPLARITGMVVDEARKPVAAAFVAGEDASEAGMGMPRMMMSGASSSASGPDGRFSLRVAGDADFRLRATKKGLPTTRSENFKLSPGERKSGLVLTIPTGVAVSGTVTDGNGDPLSGVAVTAAEAEGGRMGGMQRMVMAGFQQIEEDVVRSASDGTFSMRLKEGTYDFMFKRDGYATTAVRAQTVSAAANNIVEAKLEPAVEIRGRVTRNGVGVEGVMMFALSGFESRASTGPDGSFTLGNLTPGPTRISLRKEGDFIQEMRSLTAPANDVVIDLPVGGRVTGRVVEKGTRKPVTQFQAGLSRSRSSGGMVMMAPPQLKSFTSDDGSFTLENVPAGAHDLIASAPGFAGGRVNVTIDEGKTVEGVEVELDTGTRLTGKVTGPDGAPLSDVRVSLDAGPGGSFGRTMTENRTVTDANGEYTLEALQAGEETVMFSHQKHVSARKQVTLKGREMRLDAQLGGGQRVTGMVVTEAGMPVADAEVTARSSGGSWRTVRTNASGTFEYESLAPARYTFSASKTGYAETEVEDIDITSGAPVRITLRAGGTIYGRVTGLTKDELSNATVEANGGNDSYASASIDPEGNYRLEGAPTGTVNVVASVMSRSFTGRRTSPAQTVELEAGSARQLDIAFPSDTVIRGRVTRNGTPLKGASISFFPRNSRSQSSSSGTTDEEGNYSVTGVEAGEYNVTVIDLQRFSPYTTTYEVRGSATFDIDYKSASMRGRVVDAVTNTPVSEARVELRPTTSDGPFRGTRAVVTDSNGVFMFDGVSPGSYVANAAKEGYGNDARNLTVGEQSPDDVELKLVPGDGVTMTVVDARDGRVLDASVTVFDAQGRVVRESRVYFGGAEGAKETKLPLAPGHYTASVVSMGYALRSVSFQSPSKQTVALTPGGALLLRSKHSSPARVRLVDANGMPYPRYGLRPPYTELNPSPGTTSMEHIAPGTYTLQLLDKSNDAVLDSVRVTVTEGQVAGAEI